MMLFGIRRTIALALCPELRGATRRKTASTRTMGRLEEIVDRHEDYLLSGPKRSLSSCAGAGVAVREFLNSPEYKAKKEALASRSRKGCVERGEKAPVAICGLEVRPVGAEASLLFQEVPNQLVVLPIRGLFGDVKHEE